MAPSAPKSGPFGWLQSEDAQYVRTFLAEFVGTAILVLFTCGTCIGSEGNLVATSLSFGLTVACLVASLGHVSGCHINPAVTVGMLVSRQCCLIKGAVYIVAQLLGGVAGAAVLHGILPDTPFANDANLCATKLKGLNVAQGIAVEAFICFLLIWTICNVCESNPQLAAVVIGLAVATGHLFAIPFTSSSMNTARSFGPAVVSGYWDDHYVYWIGPLLGGALGGFFHRFLFVNKDLYDKCETSSNNVQQNGEPNQVTSAI